MKPSRSILAVVAVATASCASGGLKVRMHTASVQKPSNVAVFFSVEARDGRPVGGLSADHFRIYEDGALISPFESKQTILNPEVAVSHHVLLLLDLSGSVTEAGATPELIAASTAFAERLMQTEGTQLAVYGFDGSVDLHRVTDFTSNLGSAKSSLQRLSSFKPSDPSTNLHGAVIQGIDVLERQVAKATNPVRFATLVVFTDGTDRAHRVSGEEMDAAIRQASVDIYAIGLGADLSEGDLSRVGSAGSVRASDRLSLADAFSAMANEIEGAARKFYILSYCSPSRAGTHALRIEAVSGETTGALTYDFDAQGFGPKCDPNKKPAFSIERVLAKERELEEGGEAQASAKPKSKGTKKASAKAESKEAW